MVKRRKVLAVISLANSPALVPALAPLLPLAVHATAAAPATSPLLLRGRLLCGEHDLVLARQQGTNLTGALRCPVRMIESVATCFASVTCSRGVLSAQPLWDMHALFTAGFTPCHPHAAVELLGCGEEQGWEWVRARVLGLLPGCADVEVQHGNFLRWAEGWQGGWGEGLREGGCIEGLSSKKDTPVPGLACPAGVVTLPCVAPLLPQLSTRPARAALRRGGG